MISIVVCSVNDELYLAFSRNVGQTIGVPFEIIRIDNKQNKYSICSAYNLGKSQCQFDIICFIHEDVLFFTNNWGGIIINILKNPAIGLVGVLGACYVSLFPDFLVDFEECQGQIIDGSKEGNPLHTAARFPVPLAEVVAVDGVFLVTKKSVISQFNFSEDILNGFHGYDFDISMQIRRKYKIVVSNEIMMIHFSSGSFNSSYFENYQILYNKWRSSLPAYASSYTESEITQLKLKTLNKITKNSVGAVKYIKKNLRAFHYAFRQKVLLLWLKEKIAFMK